MPELTFYPDAHPETSSVDGTVEEWHVVGEGLTWAATVAAVGNGAYDDGVEYFNTIAIGFTNDNVADRWLGICRGILVFDTSNLPNEAVIIEAILSLYGTDKGDPKSQNPNINVYSSNPISSVALVAGDYDSLGLTPFCDSPIAYANWNQSGWNNFTLNAAGIAAISKTGVTKLGIRNANYDVAGISPTWPTAPGAWWTGFGFYEADQGDPYKPKLTVTYTILPRLPRVATLPATAISEGAAQANGMVEDDAGSPGDVSFEWGITVDYGQQTPWLSGYSSGDTFWALIYPLAPGTAYHFRARFRNRYGVVYGVDISFATLSAQGIAVLIDDAALLRFLEVV